SPRASRPSKPRQSTPTSATASTFIPAPSTPSTTTPAPRATTRPPPTSPGAARSLSSRTISAPRRGCEAELASQAASSSLANVGATLVVAPFPADVSHNSTYSIRRVAQVRATTRVAPTHHLSATSTVVALLGALNPPYGEVHPGPSTYVLPHSTARR